MKILISKTTPGQIYTTRTGTRIFIALSKKTTEIGHQPLHRVDHNGCYLVNIVAADGSINYKQFMPIPAIYEVDDGLPEPPPRDPDAPKPVREKLPESPWQGVARGHAAPESWLNAARGAGCYVQEKTHYFIVGKLGKNYWALYRHGMLAFPQSYSGNRHYQKFPIKMSAERFMPHRLSMRDIDRFNLWDDVLAFVTDISARDRDPRTGKLAHPPHPLTKEM